MATSGTTAFAPDIVEIIEEAFELAGSELRSGYQLKSARRSLDLMMIEWQNRGYNLWIVDEESTTCVVSTASYTLTAATVDVIEANVLPPSENTEYNLQRISAVDYMHIYDKTTTGRPSRIWVDRQLSGPVAYLWPVPDKAYTLKYWRLRRIEDSGSSTATPDIPYRFYPALIAGLAHKLASKIPESASRVPYLEAEFEKQFALAAEEDREKNTLYIRPSLR